MGNNHAYLYFIVIVLSVVCNWVMQLSYYLISKKKNADAFGDHKTLLMYTSSIVGDAFILPIANCLILYLLINYQIKVLPSEVMIIAAAGVLTDILIHFFQGHFGQTNWTMFEPYHWNFAGHWHMVSFFFQISFVYTFFYLLFDSVYGIIRHSIVTYGVLLCLLFFLATFLFDYMPLFRQQQKRLSQLLA